MEFEKEVKSLEETKSFANKLAESLRSTAYDYA